MREDNEPVVSQNPAAWIAAIAARQDRTAFAALFAFYAPRIKTLLMHAGASADASEDFAQEVLLAVWRNAASFNPDRTSSSAWLYTIARNLRFDRLRYDKRSKLYAVDETLEAGDPVHSDGDNSAERCERVRAALGEFPEEQVRALQLSFFKGRVRGDIGENSNCLPMAARRESGTNGLSPSQ